MQVHTILTTEDGSNTLRQLELNETFHSIHGAIQESNHIFIDAGIKEYLRRKPAKTSLNLLEIGFGTGLNVLLSMAYLDSLGITGFFHSIEKYPLDNALLRKLNYGEKLKMIKLYTDIINAAWGENVILKTNLTLWKEKLDLLKFSGMRKYDIILFDAFSPNKQAELWSEEVFKNIYKHTNEGGILTTYSAKGQVRRNIQAAGFVVERIPGPIGKREILRATKGV